MILDGDASGDVDGVHGRAYVEVLPIMYRIF